MRHAKIKSAAISIVLLLFSIDAIGATLRKIPPAKNLTKLRPTQELHIKDGETVELTACFAGARRCR